MRGTTRTTATALTAFLALGAWSCSVDKTQDGELPDVDVTATEGEIPDYDIVKTEEGRMPDVDVTARGGKWPKWDVDWADVDFGITEKTVTVPKRVKVVTEETTVKVPYINFNMRDDDMDLVERTVNIELAVPSDTHQLRIEEAWIDEDELHVIANLTATGPRTTTRATMTGERYLVSDRIVINAPRDLDIEYYIIGQEPDDFETFGTDYEFFRNRTELMDELEDEIEDARRIFTRNGRSS